MSVVVVHPPIDDSLVGFETLPFARLPLTERMAERHPSKPSEQLLQVPVFLHRECLAPYLQKLLSEVNELLPETFRMQKYVDLSQAHSMVQQRCALTLSLVLRAGRVKAIRLGDVRMKGKIGFS